jgi:hypothetical protein
MTKQQAEMEIDLEDDVLGVDPDTETEADEDEDEGVDEQPEAEAEDELVISIGEDSPTSDEEKAPQWVKDLRVKNRELARRNRELEQFREQAERQKSPQLGAKPKLEDFDYDPDKFTAATERWLDQKKAADARQAEADAAVRKEREQWTAKLEAYDQAKTQLKVRDFGEAEATVRDALNNTQLGVIHAGASKPELLVYALGKHEVELAKLAAISDPIQFAFAVARMETQLKTNTRKPSAAPETRVSGTAPSSGAETQLNKLRADAEKSGDYTKVIAYKKQLKEKRSS